LLMLWQSARDQSVKDWSGKWAHGKKKAKTATVMLCTQTFLVAPATDFAAPAQRWPLLIVQFVQRGGLGTAGTASAAGPTAAAAIAAAVAARSPAGGRTLSSD